MVLPHHLRVALYADYKSVSRALNGFDNVVSRFSGYNEAFTDLSDCLRVEGIDTGGWAVENLKQAALGHNVNRMGSIPACAAL